MKKVLYGTTALIAGVAFAGSAFAAPIELSIGGKQNVFVGVGGIDDDAAGTDWSNIGMTTDTELYFTGATTLDNGITVKAIIQLEAEASSTSNADEQAIQFTGNFGSLQLGQRQGFAGSMAYDAPSAGGVIGNDEYWTYLGPINTAYNYYTSDDLGVSYITPSFFGFTLAADYAPEVDGNDDGGFFDYNATVGTTDITQFGVNFDNDFSGVSLHGDAQYAFANGEGGTSDFELWRGGAAIGYMGFEVGGSYGYWDYDNGNDTQAWLVGASYQNGPYGVAFQFEEMDIDNTSDTWGIMASGNYILAPGIDLGAAIFHADQDGRGATADATGTGGFVGVGLSF